MFQFTGFPTYTYVLGIRYMESVHVCFHIRISTDRGICAPPRSFSQLVTSFFGSQCQGIHHLPFFVWPSVSLLRMLACILWSFGLGCCFFSRFVSWLLPSVCLVSFKLVSFDTSSDVLRLSFGWSLSLMCGCQCTLKSFWLLGRLPTIAIFNLLNILMSGQVI